MLLRVGLQRGRRCGGESGVPGVQEEGGDIVNEPTEEVKVFFSQLRKTVSVYRTAETAEVLRYLYRDGETFVCVRNIDTETLLSHRIRKAEASPK